MTLACDGPSTSAICAKQLHHFTPPVVVVRVVRAGACEAKLTARSTTRTVPGSFGRAPTSAFPL